MEGYKRRRGWFGATAGEMRNLRTMQKQCSLGLALIMAVGAGQELVTTRPEKAIPGLIEQSRDVGAL